MQQVSVFLSLFVLCISTGWRRLIGFPKLQIIFHKRATKYRLLLRKMTYQDKGSYESSPPSTLQPRRAFLYLLVLARRKGGKRACLGFKSCRDYGVASISRLLKIIGLFFKRVV